MKVKVTMNPSQQVLRERGLEKGGKVQQFFGNEIARLSDPYVPMRQGVLKNTVQVLENGAEVRYIQPYAGKQWHSNRKVGSATGALRGPRWTFRMWAARGKEIKNSAAKLAGGKAE